jgi:hypothetical protein
MLLRGLGDGRHHQLTPLFEAIRDAGHPVSGELFEIGWGEAVDHHALQLFKIGIMDRGEIWQAEKGAGFFWRAVDFEMDFHGLGLE